MITARLSDNAAGPSQAQRPLGPICTICHRCVLPSMCFRPGGSRRSRWGDERQPRQAPRLVCPGASRLVFGIAAQQFCRPPPWFLFIPSFLAAQSRDASAEHRTAGRRTPQPFSSKCAPSTAPCSARMPLICPRCMSMVQAAAQHARGLWHGGRCVLRSSSTTVH